MKTTEGILALEYADARLTDQRPWASRKRKLKKLMIKLNRRNGKKQIAELVVDYNN